VSLVGGRPQVDDGRFNTEVAGWAGGNPLESSARTTGQADDGLAAKRPASPKGVARSA
jgi:hypothetical protein